ncbi:MAG: histidine kinase [Breznakibacter sp.]
MFQFFRKNAITILHICAWASILVIPQYIIHTFGDGNGRSLTHFYVNTTIYGVMFYSNYLILTPKFYLNNRKWAYFGLTLLVIALLYTLQWLINDVWLFDPQKAKEIEEAFKAINKDKEYFKPPIQQFKLFMFTLAATLINGFALGLAVLQRLGENERTRKELEKEKLNSELAMLKNQLSPHFFFNTLNNIYSLVEIDGKRAQEAILKLSKMMRYLLYESEQGKTPLSHEIAFMENYIDLMKLRLSSKVELIVDFPYRYDDIEVPPLLLISFIENAFKHGISYREASFVHIVLQATSGKMTFTCENSLHKQVSSSEHDENRGGIGLENIKKRLLLLYPNTHRLEIGEDGRHFLVNLEIEL